MSTSDDVRMVAPRRRRAAGPGRGSHSGPPGPLERLLRKLRNLMAGTSEGLVTGVLALLAAVAETVRRTRVQVRAGMRELRGRPSHYRARIRLWRAARRNARATRTNAVTWAPAMIRAARPQMFRNARSSRSTIPPGTAAARLLAILGGGIAGVLVILLVAGSFVPAAARAATRSLTLGIAPAEQAKLTNLSQRSVVLAGDGTVLDVLHDEIDRKVVPLETVPEHVRAAVITAEDRKFWEHRGYDFEGIGRALVANFRARSIEQGGSTITQQIAKSVVGDEQSLQRKLNELAYAVALEREYTKDELLGRYLNQVYFGAGAYGIAAAAEEYFGLSDPSQLRVEQGALLAGLIRSPGSLDPRRHPEEATARRNQVLADMAELGYLEPSMVDLLVRTPLGVVPPSDDAPVDPYLTAAVQHEFLANPVFGPDRQARIDLLFGGGLRIETSVDPRLQQVARDVVNAALPSSRGPTAAIAAVDPRDGRILAIYGGADFSQEQFNLATQGRRQPGSSFKPFVMATALQRGFPLQMQLPGDSPLRLPNSGSPEWEVKGVSNYGGADYGRIDLRSALVNSVNTAFAQLMMVVGTQPVLDVVSGMGIDIEAATAGVHNPSMALGGLERGVTPLEMASAYGTFANGGGHVPASLINRVTGPDGTVLYGRKPEARQAIDPGVAAAMVRTMQDVVNSGTGTRAQLSGWQVAGKTGTTQRNVDAWFVGYTPVMSTAVWMGYPQGQVPMPGRTGGSIPASIWRAFMTQALAGVQPIPFPPVPAGTNALAGQGPVSVPDVTGMSELDALRALAEARLIGDIRQVSSRAPAGTVVSQEPAASAVLDSGDAVVLNVSSGQGEPPRQVRGGGRQGGGGGGVAPPAPAPAAPDLQARAPQNRSGRGGGGGRGGGR